MSDQEQPPSETSVPPTPSQESAPPPPPPPAGMSPYQAPAAPVGYGQSGPIGEVRSTGICILLYFVTLGFYSWYWYFKTHEEMKRHSGQGIGGGIALILAIFVGFVLPYINSSEVGNLRESRGQDKRVSAGTGLWYFPGALILVGPFIWFIKTNDALNDYWRSQGAVG